MPQSTRNISVIVRAVGATLFAIVLWGIVSLSDQFEVAFDVPISVEMPPDRALVEPIPSSIRVNVRADGWSQLKILASGRVECVLRPLTRANGDAVPVGYGARALLASIRTDIPGAQQVSVAPDTLTLVLGPVDRKVVALVPEATLNTRKGFQVIGGIRVEPDSITLVGARRVLDDITSWPTEALHLDDLHKPVALSVPVSDTLRGIITPVLRRAELHADVQEVAERVLLDVPIINRGMAGRGDVRVVLHPPRVQVMLRGGARDLSRLDPGAVRLYVQIAEGADTLGVVEPRLILPPGLSINAVAISPARVRYLFRREVGRNVK